MRAIVLDRYGPPETALAFGEVARPVPRRGQVLVKIAATPINPSDLAFIEGNYAFRKTTPAVPGFEAAGVVVEANAGLHGRWLVGKRVACSAPEDGNGTWAEFMACSALACVPLKRATSTAFGATLLVNPLTALSHLAAVKSGGHRAFIQTAAGSALGRMMGRLAALRGVPVINVVRRREAAAEMRAAGAAHVLSTDEASFDRDLAALSRQLGATIAFEAIGGGMPKRLATAMPDGSKVVLFGGLGSEDPVMPTQDTIFRGKTLEGFWLARHIRKIGLLRLLAMTAEVQRRGEGVFGANVIARLPLEQIGDALALQRRASEGKVLLVP